MCLSSRAVVLWLALMAVLVGAGQVRAAPAGACTATFTSGPEGTFPATLKLDGKSGLLTVDLSGIPRDAEVFRAELVLRPVTQRVDERTTQPTVVHPAGEPEKRLRFVPPRYASLDALEVVRTAHGASKPVELEVKATAQGVSHLEVSYLGGRPKAQGIPLVTSVKVLHRRGQSLLVFAEPKLEEFPEFRSGGDVRSFADQFAKRHPGLALRIWRSSERITPRTIATARLVGQCGFFSAWNSTYHQDDTAKKAPLLYRVIDGGEPLPWGTGMYAHNPTEPGKAYYAVTVAQDGEEDLSQLNEANTTAEPADETVGPGEPVLQWTEQPDPKEGWQYRRGRIIRLVYTRWESWPHCSAPSRPIDYLVVIPLDEGPKGAANEPEYRASRVDPAPVGLHLHCWGGSLNGGYGWWHNAHRGAVLIASNQIPYDWWTGYHEAMHTCKTLGDGHVQPFTMNRMLGFLDWAARQHEQAPETVRAYWPHLDLKRVFTAGISMGGAGAPMFGLRYGDRIAWSLGWVGVHVPEMSPQFTGSYRGNYGPRDQAITMPDGETSPWDYFSDPWWLRSNVKAETAFIIASNGKNDGGIGWPQAVLFARALQETRRPHLFNWGLGGHGTRTLIGENFDLDVRTDQTLPAFTNCTLDNNIGTATPKPKEQIEAEKTQQEEEVAAGKRKEVVVDPFDGDPTGAYNAFLRWGTEDIVDTAEAWEMTVLLLDRAPADSCKVDLTPRRLQVFRTPRGAKFAYTVADLKDGKLLAEGTATADEHDLLTLKQLPLVKGANRVKISPAGL